MAGKMCGRRALKGGVVAAGERLHNRLLAMHRQLIWSRRNRFPTKWALARWASFTTKLDLPARTSLCRSFHEGTASALRCAKPAVLHVRTKRWLSAHERILRWQSACGTRVIVARGRWRAGTRR